MRQTLFYLPVDILGVPLFGKGIFFWAILIAGLIAIVRALLQKKFEDLIFFAFITALGVFIVNTVGLRIVEPQGFPIRGYGVFLTLAIIIASAVTIQRGKKMWNYPVDALLAIIFVAAFCGLIGARLFYVAQYWNDVQSSSIKETIVNIVDVTNGGLVVYGSILGGIIAVIIFLLVKKLPVLATLDLFAPGLALGIAIGRIGCLMNGCCFGGPCDLPWGVVFPEDSPAYVQQLDEGVISLYGITLAQPETKDDQKDDQEETFFSLKSKRKSLATETIAPVIVASVDPGSEAEQAGIKAGDRICNMGIVPKGFDAAAEDVNEQTKQRKIERYGVKSNAQVFYFFLNIWDGNPDADVLLTLMEQNPNEQSGENGKKADAVKVRNVVFHPTRVEAKPVHPTQIYSSINALIIFGLLMLLAKFAKKDGLVFAGLLILYPIHRFCIELVRTDEESFYGTGLTISQCVSLGVLAIGIIVAFYAWKGSAKRALEGFFPEE